MTMHGKRELCQSSAIRDGFLPSIFGSSFPYSIFASSSILAWCAAVFLFFRQLQLTASVSLNHSSPALVRNSSPSGVLPPVVLCATSPSSHSFSGSFGIIHLPSSDDILLANGAARSVFPRRFAHAVVSEFRTAVPTPTTAAPALSRSLSFFPSHHSAGYSSQSPFSPAATEYCAASVSLTETSTALRPSRTVTTHAAPRPAAAASLLQHPPQCNSCFLHTFVDISCLWTSKPTPQCTSHASLSRWRQTCGRRPQTLHQQQHHGCQRSALFSSCSRSLWRRQVDYGRRRNGSISSLAARCVPYSSISIKGKRRLGTALFDSQEERFSALKSLKEQETPKFQADNWTPEMPLLEVKDLHVVAVEDGQEILKGVNLTVMPGEVHAIMGRNGSGKSTLSKVLAGYPSYKVTQGTARYKGLDLFQLPIDNRGLAGLFLAFQYPIEIPMVSNLEFLRVAFNERRKWKGEEDMDSDAFRTFVESKLLEVGLESSFLTRPLNYGFSGGEKKRNEILQMIVLDPELVMLDETDSGLDVDSFNVTAAAIKRFAARKNKSFLVTTHYKKLLDALLPHKIHVMHAGKVILSGDLSLASRIEKEGFASLISDDPREEEEERKGLAKGENLLENDEAYEPPTLTPSAAGGGRRDLDKLL